MKDERMLIAKKQAGDKYPYYGPVLVRTRPTEVDESKCSTMCINNRFVLQYNPKFIAPLSNDQLESRYVHEVMHPMSDHFHRSLVYQKETVNGKKVSFTILNIGMDMEINQYLVKEDISIGEDGWIPSKLGYPDGKKFEDYVDMMMKDIEQDRFNCPNPNSNIDENGNGDPNEQLGSKKEELIRQLRNHQDAYESLKKVIHDAIGASTDNIDMTNAEETDAETQAEIQDVLNEVKENAKAMSLQGHGGENIIRKVPRKKYDWKKVLASLVRNKVDAISRGRDKSTFTKVNRRLAGMNSDIIFSHKYSEDKTFNLVVGIDVSGSMGDLVNEMYSRLKSIDTAGGNKSHITVVECDTDITKVMVDFKPYTDAIESTNGGGTDMESIPRWVKKMVDDKKLDEPDLIVIMTDNYCSWSSKPLFPKKTVVLTNNITEDCRYKQYEITL